MVEAETEMTASVVTSAPKRKRFKRLKLKDVEIPDDPEEDKEEKKRKLRDRTFKTRVVQGVGITTIVFSLLTLALNYETVALIASFVAVPVSVLVIIYQFKLQDTDSLRKVINILRQRVNDFADENERLVDNNEDLEKELAPLKETEKKLESIAKESGFNANKLKELVKANGKYQEELKGLIDEEILTRMMDEVLDTDWDRDGHFEDSEIDDLFVRLNIDPTINVNEKLFMAKMKSTRDLAAAFKTMRTITDHSIPEDERIFAIDYSQIQP